jgi:hypothetical protein
MLSQTDLINDEIIAEKYIEIFTNGHPRSGNSWIGRLLSDLLNCPWQEFPGAPILYYGSHHKGNFVIRKMHTTDSLSGLSVFIYRDPRDVCVSWCFYGGHPSIRYTIEEMNESESQLLDHYGNYEEFVRSQLDRPEKYTVSLRYEDLHESPLPVLRKAIKSLTGTSLTDDYISESYDRQRFENVLDKYPDYSHSMREGLIGDWKNHFRRDDGRLFQEYFGRLMLDQEYIEDGDWWEELPI